MDINDDHDVAEKLLLEGDCDARARAAGIRVIIGCGSTPGLTNVMARLLVDRLDKPTAIHLSTVVPFVPGLLSPTVIDHMMHITSGEVVQFRSILPETRRGAVMWLTVPRSGRCQAI